MSTSVVGILDYLASAEVEAEILGPDVDVRCLQWRWGEPFPAAAADLDAVALWHLGRLEAAELRALRRCRAVVRVGVGYDNVDIEAAGHLGLPVATVPDYGVNDVADHTWALLLALARRLSRYTQHLHADPIEGWNPDAGGPGMRRITGRRLGIIGFGRIGSAVARRAAAFGMDVAFFDPYKPTGEEKCWQVQRMEDLDELLAWAEVVTLHTPATSETRGMIDARALSLLRPGALLLNTARGELVDHEALASALRSGALGGYGADVWHHEPPRADDPILAAHRNGEDWLLGRFVLTPHCAFRSEDCTLELRRKAALQLRRALDGEPLPDCVNLSFLRDPRTPARRRTMPR